QLRGWCVPVRDRRGDQAPPAQRARRRRDDPRARRKDRSLRGGGQGGRRPRHHLAVTPPGSMNTGPREWDAQTYDRVSDPQFEWGVEVLDRLELAGDEHVMDACCGSGRVTVKLLEKLPDGRVLCVDASESMMEKAREALGDRADYLVADLAELDVNKPVDTIFSTATFHWLPDHDRLFSRLHAALRPAGRLVAQCGGAGNVAQHARHIVEVATRPEVVEHFQDMSVMWNFATPLETEERLRRAGCPDVRCCA